jgi:hypothetical protein
VPSFRRPEGQIRRRERTLENMTERRTLLPALALLLMLGAPSLVAAQPAIIITNACSFAIWIDQTPNTGFARLPSDNRSPAHKLTPGQTENYAIPQNGCRF